MKKLTKRIVLLFCAALLFSFGSALAMEAPLERVNPNLKVVDFSDVAPYDLEGPDFLDSGSSNVIPFSAGYSGYIKYINNDYFYAMCSDQASGMITRGYNDITTHSSSYNSLWRYVCRGYNIGQNWASSSYRIYYEDHEMTLDREYVALQARANSNVGSSQVQVAGTFYADH